MIKCVKFLNKARKYGYANNEIIYMRITRIHVYSLCRRRQV